MANPFEDEGGRYLVLINEEGQHSLWPHFREIPGGWKNVGMEGTRSACLEWINEHWTDMRPKTLIMEMDNEKAGRAVAPKD